MNKLPTFYDIAQKIEKLKEQAMKVDAETQECIYMIVDIFEALNTLLQACPHLP